ncbi:MAG: hypothetical protein Q8L37_03405 [Candidatus Gottesmanbacteria bacterium]|nr:hypothetical protein [Candidatus Gottesmanbacteria bacterium]
MGDAERIGIQAEFPVADLNAHALVRASLPLRLQSRFDILYGSIFSQKLKQQLSGATTDSRVQIQSEAAQLAANALINL